MADNENSTSSYVALNNNYLLYAFVNCSTDIDEVITKLLEYMAVRGKANRSLPFILKFKHEKIRLDYYRFKGYTKGLNSCTRCSPITVLSS